ncbi:Ig-like domain-containing protein [Pantoea vagans]|uniref:BapA prefix-like domain-containing protein n=5 Tax=Pantoea TaxID=53335 RepID=A0A0U3UW49_9GAMM|nr:Ig-like domain-containing protein [Pantoea vagans]ALV91137.1 hypothetical protein LK04_02775 [Pantoea vagans]
MNNISITPKGGTVDTVVNGSQVNLTAPSVVKLHLNQSDIKSFTRNGNDLVVTTKSGEVVVIHNFYTTAGDSDLVLQDDKGALWWVEDPGTEGFQYVNIDTTEGLLAENTTNDGTIAAFGIGGAALAGLGAMFAGSSGGGGGNAPVNDGNTGGGDNGGGNNGGGNNGGGNNGGGNTGGGDTTPPGAVTDLAISDNVGPYQGAIIAGSVTDDNTPTLSGSAEAGATVRIYDGSTLLGSAVVGADGKWTFTSPALADGSHSLTVTVTDAAGNTSAASDPINFTVDTTAPEAVSDLTVSNNAGSVVLPVTNGGSTNDTTPLLSGRGEVGSIITIRDGDTILGSVTVGSNGSWSFTSPELSQGSHTLSITSTDAAGNTSAATTITFTVDTVAPAAATDLSMTGDANGTASNVLNGGTTDDSTPTLSGRGEAGAVVSVYDNNTLIGTAVVGSDGTWSFITPALSNGSHSLTVTQTDAAGNVGPASSAYEITVDAGLPPATTSLEITDDSGNTLVQLSNGDSTHDSTPTLSGLATAGALITLYNGSTEIGSVVADADGQWSFTPAALADGTYNFHASVTDADGNVTQTPNIAITIDTVAPAAASGLQLSDNDNGTVQPIASGGATNTTTPHLSGTAEPGSTVTIRDGDTVLGTATVGSNGTWSFTSPTLSEGSHSLTTTVTDPAGNTSPATDPITFTVDTQAPAGASDLVVSDNVGAVTGPLAAGATTDDSTPTLSGKAEANSIVKVYDGSTLLGSAAADSSGNWSFTTPTLSNGAHTLSVTVTDAAGNVSPATTGFGLTVNAGVPPTTSTLQVTDDSGSTLKVLPDGSSTHDKTPILNGLAAAGDVITIYNGTTVLGSTTAGADGQWSFTPASLADGTYAFHAVATDSTGNPTNSVTINITIDTVAPAAAGDLQLSNNNGTTVTPIAAGGTTSDNTPVLSGTAEPGSTVTVRDGDNVLGTVTVGSNGSWSFTSPALGEGNHSLTTTVTDAAGNTGPASSPIAVTVDTTPPAAVSGLVVTDNVGDSQGELTSGAITDDNTPTLSGTGEPNALLSIYDGTTLLGNTTVGADGTWSFTTAALSNGSHSFTITATDAAGNVGPTSPPFVIDIEADLPTASDSLEVIDDNGNTVEQLVDGASTNDPTPVLIGSASPGNIITLYDGDQVLGSTTAGANGQWSFRTGTLSDGPHAIHGTITDAAGNITDTITVNIIVDTVAPDAVSGLQVSNDAGSTSVPITAGSITNDASPVLTGSAEAGSVVTIRDGNTVLGTVTVGSTGNWTFTTPALGDGSHSLTATATDAAGNSSPATTPVTFTVDTTAPAAASGLVLTDNAGTSTGALTSGATTDDSTPTLSGTAEAGSIVKVYDGSALLGSAAVGSDGSWSFTPASPLTNGQHNLTTTVTDAAGNVSPASPAFTVNIDAGVPTTNELIVVADDSGSTIVQLEDNSSTHDSTPVLSGLAGAGDLITIYNGTTVLGTVTAGSDGQWNFTPTALADGTYAFHATATNATTGVISDTPTINVTIDTVAPAAPTGVGLTNGDGDPIPSGSSTNTTTPTLEGNGEPGGTVTITDGTTVIGTTTVNDDGTWSYTTPPLSDGNHSLTTTVTDPAGNTGPASTPVTVTVDTQPPAAAGNLQLSNDGGTPIASGGSTNDSTPTLNGTAEPGSTVTVSDGGTVIGSTTTGSDGTWSYTPNTPLDDGSHSLTTTVTDPAGNTGPASSPVTVTVDTTPPAVATGVQLSNDSSGTAVPITNGTTNDTTPVLTGRAEPGSTVTVSDNGNVIGTTTVGNDGNWSFTPSSPLGDGSHSLTTTVTDTAGNTGGASAPVTVTVDTSIPTVPGNVALSNDEGTTSVPISSGTATNDATPVLSGTAPEGSTITVSDGGTVLGTVVVGDSGNWSFTPTDPLGEGSHSITATTTSPAGNTSGPSTPIMITVDTTPPAAATGLQLSNDSSGTAVPIAANGTTNDTTPVLTGSAEPGSTVTVSDNGTVLGTAIVGSNGSWSFTPTTPLEAGSHSLTTTVTDPAGNTGTASTPVAFNVDTTQPDPASGLVLNNDNSGTPVPITNGATNDTTPVLTGTADAGSTVTVLDGTTVLGTVVVGDNGSWSFTTPALSQGEHSLTTTVTSPVGNVSDPSAPIVVTVDTQAPASAGGLQFTTDDGTPIATGGSTSDTTPTLSGTAEAGSTVTVSEGNTVLGSVVVGSDGTWSFTPTTPLDEGSHSLTTVVTDPAGNSSAPTSEVIVIVDSTSPGEVGDLQLSNDSTGVAVPITAGSATNDSTPVLSGTAEAGSIVTVKDNGIEIGTAIVGSDGNWSFTPATALDDGPHSLTTIVTDSTGNAGPESDAFAFSVDTVAPDAANAVVLNNDNGGTAVPITSGSATNDTTPVLSGTAEAGSIVTVRDGDTILGSVQVTDGGTWSFPSPALSQGSHSLTATVTDAAGNSSQPSTAITFTVDTQAPATAGAVQLSNDSSGTSVPITAGSVTNDNTPVLSGTAEVGSTVTILDGSNVLGTVVVGTGGTWSFTPTLALGEGAHSITTTVTDAAGNVSAPSAAIGFTVDSTPPATPVVTSLSNNNGGTAVVFTAGSTTNDSTPVIRGTGEVGATVTIRDGSTILGTAIVGTNGIWRFEPTTALGQGSHTLTVTATDTAGNTSAASAGITFSVDTIAPDAITNLVAKDDSGNTLTGVTNDSTPALSGTAEAGSIIKIYDGSTLIGSTQAGTNGDWNFTTQPLTDGSHSLSATATDTAGNVSAAGNVVTVTVDTSVPVTPEFVVNNNDVTPVEPVANNGYTNDNTPALSGTATANSLVIIYDGDTAIGSVTTNAQGVWSFTTDTLDDGAHALTITVTDSAGNVSPASSVTTINVDTVTPDVATNVLVNNNEGSTLVPIAADGATNDTTPELTGSAEAGTIVRIYDGTDEIGSVLVGSTGNWTYTTDTLTQGEHNLSVTVTDAAGNTSANSPTLTFTVDSEAPDAATGLTLANNNSGTEVPIANNGTTNDSTPLLRGTAEANSTIIISDGNTVLGTATADGTGSWSFSPTLTDGTHNLTAVVRDEAGNTSPVSGTVTVTIDTVAPPSVTNLVLTNNIDGAVNIPNGGLTNDNTPVLSGNGEVGSIITISDASGVLGSTTVIAGGTWSFTPTTGLADGSHTFSVTASDTAGNVSGTSTISAVIDATPPAAPSAITASNDNGTTPVAIASNATTNDSTPFLSGSGEAGSIIRIYDGATELGSTAVGSNGQWSFSVPALDDGSYTLRVTATDAAGNTSQAADTVNFTVDATPPAIPTLVVTNDITSVVVNNNGLTNDNTPSLSGNAEANSVVTIYDGTTVIGSTTSTGAGTWTFTSPTLTDGSHTLTVTVADEAGNVSTSAATTVRIDATPPQPVSDLLLQNNNDTANPTTIANGGTTNDSTPVVSGQAEVGSTVTVYEGTTVLGTAVVDAEGNWSVTTSTLSNATHTLTINVTDPAGNISSNTTATVTVDTTTPAEVTTFAIYNNANTTPVLVANDGYSNDNTPVLRGTGVAGTTINIIIDGVQVATTTVASNGVWRYETGIEADGPHSYTVSVTNAAGTTGPESTPIQITIDTSIPTTVQAGTLVVSDDVGTPATLASGDTTDDNTPTFSGTVEGNATVSVYDGTTLLGTATASGTGAWTFTPATGLSNGDHSFTFTVTDQAGNISAASTPAFTLNIEAGLPTASGTLVITDDSGSMPVNLTDGASTKDTTPVLTGAATAGDVITIHDGSGTGTVLGSVTVGADGQWSFTPTLADGSHAIYVTNLAGTESDTINITVDTVAPVAVSDLAAANNNGSTPVAIANNGITNDSTPLLTGTTEANGIVTIYDGNTVVGSTTASGTGAWSFISPTLSQGAHTLSVTVTDAAGNVGPRSSTVSFTIDSIAPNATTLVVTNDTNSTTVPNNGSTNDTTPTLSGTAEANGRVSVYDGTTLLGTAIASATGAWTFTSTALTQGTHTLNVTVTDAAGNVSGTTSSNVVIDTTPPAAVAGLAAANNNGSTPVAIAAGSSTNDNTPALSGTAEAGSVVRIYDGGVLLGSVTASSTGAWSYTSTQLADGSHTINVTATDAAGNISPNASITFTVVTGAPNPVAGLVVNDNAGTVQGNLTSGQSTDDTTPTLSGTATAGNIVVISEGTTVLGSVVAGSNGAWTFTTAALSEGSHPLSVTVRDAAGNTSTATNFTVVVDTVAPATSSLVVTNDVTSTAVPNGGSTNDTTPTLSGVAEANGRVSIYDGSTLLGTTTASATGAWSFTSTTLAQGSHTLNVTVTDAAGNVSGTTSSVVVIDTTPPAAVASLAAANNNGSTPIAIAAGSSTNDNTPAISGTAEAGSVVKVYDGGTLLGSVIAGSNGAWSLTSTTLADGSHTINVTATDAAGNVSPNASITFTVDTGVPVAVTNLVVTNDVTNTAVPNGGSTNDNTPTLSGTAEANAIVTVYDGTTVLGSTTASGTGAWSFVSPALSNGTHPLSVTVKDAAGNVSPASTTVSVIVDTVAPNASTLVITNDVTNTTVPNGGSTNDSTPTLSGTAEVGSIVRIYDGSTLLTSITVGSTGNWSYTTGVLSQGSHPISVTSTDAAGNVSATTSATVTVDTVVPTLTLAAANNNGSSSVAIAAGTSTNDNTPALSGTTEANSVVRIFDGGVQIGSVTASSTGAWSWTSTTLAEGAHTITATATDAAGNVSNTPSITFTVDTVVPNAVTNLVVTNDITSTAVPNGGSTNDNTPTLSGTAEANAIVTVYDGTTVLGSTTASGTGAWSFVSPVLTNGSHPLSVTVKDAAGNVSPASTTVTVTVDTVAPNVSTLVITNDVTNTTVASGGSTNDTTPTLSGTAEAGSRVTIYDGTTVLGTAIASGTGAWTFTTSVLTQGSHPISVSVTDAAGNVSGRTNATVVIDTTPPAAVTSLVAANNNGSTAVTIPNNGVTNDSTPLLTGNGEVGAKVSIYDGSNLLGTTTVGSNGSWSFISTTLSNGTHTINVTQTDVAGNVSPTASTVMTIDTVAPAAVTNLVINDDVGASQGPLANGAVTDDATPTLSGTAEANAIVTIYDGTTVLGSVTASNTGAWTFTTATLSNGTHPLSVTVTDAAGNTSAASATVSITVDTVAPAVSTLVITNDITNTTVPSGGYTNDTTPTLSGVAEAGSRVSIYDGSTLLGTVTAGSNGAWTFTTAVLTQGSHPINVTVTDPAGNVSGTTSATVIVDSVAPAAVTSLVAANNNGSTAVTIPNNGVTNDNTPLLSGSGEVGAIVKVYDGSVLLGSTTVGSNGTWSLISGTLSNGTHTINVTQTDAAGNVSPTASTIMTIDTVAPTASSLTITDDTGSTPVSLANGAYTKDTTPTLSGTAEVGAVVTIYDGATILGSVTVGSSGAWTYTTAVLANGAHPLSTTVTDAAGNVSTGNTTATVNIDTVAPVAVTNLAINAAGTTVTGSGEVGDTVTVRDASGNSLGTATVGSAGTWSVTLSTAQTTGASLSVIQTDRAGNVSPSAALTGAIRIVATNDTNEVDYTTATGTVTNANVSDTSTALLSVNLGTLLGVGVLTSNNAYTFSVGTGDTRTVTLHGSVTSLLSVTANYTLYLYKQNADGTWSIQSSNANYIQSFLSLGTQTGGNVTYSNLTTGNYAVVLGSSNGISALPSTTIYTTSDITTLAVTVAATVTGNLLTNDTSSVSGTVPTGTAVTTVSGSAVAASGNTVINTTYGTLTIDSHGNYTYTLKAGLDIDTLPTADTFTYSVRDASGAVTSASLTVTLHNGVATSLTVNSLLAETTSTSATHDASGSIYSDSTTHTGTLSITNEHGDVTTVHSVGTTSIAGDYGVLSIAANGSYTYTLNAGVDGQSLLHKEVFSYTLAATDGTITTQSFTIDLHPTITGTAGADTITGGAYNDTITTGAGADTLVYHLLASADSTGGNGHDTWTDFNVAQGDKIDISNLLIGWNDSTSNINDFVKVDHTSDGNTVLSIDRDGTGTGYSSTQLITLEGVNVSLEELLQQPHQTHTA